MRSSERPVNAAFSKAAGWYGDLWIRCNSDSRVALLTTLALQLHFSSSSESLNADDSEVADDGCIDRGDA